MGMAARSTKPPIRPWCDCRNGPKFHMTHGSRMVFWAQRQSYQNVSRETCLSGWARKSYKMQSPLALRPRRHLAGDGDRRLASDQTPELFQTILQPFGREIG